LAVAARVKLHCPSKVRPEVVEVVVVVHPRIQVSAAVGAEEEAEEVEAY